MNNNSKEFFWPAITIFLVGMHSIFLGLVIYFFTDFFYRLFFAAGVENPFFVRQSGAFLFLAGLFYLYPLFNLKTFYSLVLLVVVSKIVAVLFLVSNAAFTTAPFMIYLAALFDGLMAVVLLWVYFRLRMLSALEKRHLSKEETGSG